MASFPDLRPSSRSAKAESKAARRFKPSVLLAVSAALLLTALLAVSELATLRGGKAHDASAFLTRELGPPLDRAPLVREPARNVKVSLRDHGYRVTRGTDTVGLTSSVRGAQWQHYRHGVQRESAIGRETILIGDTSAEEFLTVTRHQGRRTWRWRLDTKLDPRVTPRGYVGFFRGNRLTSLEIEPVAILDAHGKDITPNGLGWSLTRRGHTTWLELTLDDRGLEIPYTIDPTISFRTAGTLATSPSGTSISVGIPAGAVASDLLLLHVAVRSTTIPTTPSGWTVVSGTNTANTTISQVVFWRKTLAGDPGTNVSVTIPNAAAVGVVTVYRGVDTSASPPIQQTTTSSTSNNRNVTCPGLTTTAANEMVVCHGTTANSGTWPANGGGYTLRASGSQSTNITLGAYDQFVATLGTAIAATTFSNVAPANSRNIGNTFGLKPDTSAPTTTVTAPTEVSGAANQHYVAATKTHWFRSTASGSFTLNATATDSESGVVQVDFPDISAVSGWSGSTGGNDTTSPYSSPVNYTWTSSATAPGARNITATNNAQDTGTDTITISDDTGAPSVTAPTVTAGYYTSLSVPVTLNGGTDGDSGVAAGSSVVQRDEATLSGGSCGSFPGTWATVTLTGGADTGVQNGKCYRYREQLTDNVGNTGSSSASATAMVDNAGPSNSLTLTSVSPAGSALKSGDTVYYRGVETGGGSFKLRNAVSDSESGAASSQTAALGGTTTGWTHTPSTVSTPAGGPYDSNDFSWSQGTTSSPTEVVTGRDTATNATTAATLTFVDDSSAPAGGALTVNGRAASAGGTSSYDGDGSFTIGTRTDYTDSGSGLASSTLVRTIASYSSPDTCGSFGSPTTITGNPDQTGLATGCYRYTLTGTDNLGNTVSISSTVKVDTTAPSDPALTLANATGGAYYPGSGTSVYFRPDAANGGFDITASSTDDDSGVASYSFPAGGSIGTNWSASGSGSSRTYSYTATATTNGLQNVTATNNAGGTSGNSSFEVTADSTAPAGGALTVNGTAASVGGTSSYDGDGSFTIGTRTDYTDGGAGLASSTLVRTSASYSSPDTCGSFGSPTTITGNPDQTGLTTGCYRYTLTGTDNVGNAASISTTVKVDTTAPSSPALTYSNATGGTYYPGAGAQIFFRPSAASGAFDLAASSSDGDTGISGYTFPSAGSMGTNWSASGSGASRTYSFTPTADEPGTKSVSATNNAGSSASSNFTVTADSTAPTTTIQCNAAACLNGSYYTSAPVTVTLSANDGTGSGVQKIRYTTDGSDPTPVNGSDYVGALSINTTTTVKFRAYDNLNNEEAVGSQEILLDGTPPTLSLTLTENPASGAQHVSGGTLFYRPGASGGTFRVAATADDPHTGVTSVDFPAIANVTGGGSQPTPPYREDYTWSASTTDATSHDVVATNGASATTAVPFTLTQDSAAPTGQTLTLTGANAPYYGSASVTFTLGDGNDGSGSGLDTTTRTVTRESAPLTGDSCGSFSADAGTYTSPDTSVSGGNCYRYTFTIKDNVGNTSTGVTATAKVDTDDPSVSLTDPGTPVGGTVALSATASDPSTTVQQVVFERSPAGAGTWTTIGTDNTAPYTAGWDTTGVSDGDYDLRALATDALSHTGTSVVANRRVDNTPPNTTIDSNPPAVDNDATPTFTFSSSESGSTFQCRIDAGSWSSCSSPHTVSPALTEDSHTFDVRATDAAGNTDGTPASYTWTIDLGAPTVTITAPTTYLNSSDPSTYPVTASTPHGDVVRIDFFECSNTSTDCATGTWTQFGTDNTSPYSADWSTPGSDGTKAIRAVAVDVGSNTGEHVRTITIDRTPPSSVTVSYPNNYVFGSFAITTDNGPDPDVNAASGALERRTGDLANNTCTNYGGWVAASSPDTVATEKCAQYRYRVADNAGNWTTATSGNEVKSDTNEPTSIQADPGANLRQTVNLTAVASDTGGSGLTSVAFQRRPAGGGSWTTIGTDTSSPYGISFDTTVVSDGLYDFRSVATDTAGNVESAPAVIANRRIDNTAPSATMLSPGNPVRGTVTLTSNTSDTGGSGIDSVSYELAPNGGSFNSQPASWDTTLVSDGLYDLRVIATDVAGNSTTSALITTRVDNTPPALTFSSPASGAVVSGTVNLVATSSDASPASPPVSFAYKLASDPPSAYTSTGASWNTTTLPGGDGLYDLRAQATDDAGNTRTVENTNVRVDNAAPTISITAPPTAVNGSVPSPTTFSATATDPGGSGVAQVEFFECSNQSLDCATGIWSPLGNVAAPGPYEVNWTIPGADGNHALAAVATDNAGHPSTAIRNVDVDRSAPNTTIVSKPADPSSDVTPTFTFTSSEPGSTFECKIDGGSFASCTSPHNIPGLTDNAHTFDVRATDPAGNTDATPDTWTWHRDTGAPTGTLNSPGANIRQIVTLTSTENDPAADGYASGLASVAYEYSADGTSWASIGTLTSAPFDTILWNTTGVADGVYQLRIVVRDVAGNETISSVVTNVRVDNTAPTTSQNDPGPYLRALKTLTGSAADSGSGIDHVDFQRAPTGGGSWTTIASDSTPGDGFSAAFDTTAVSDGHYDFRTVAFDVAGNQAAATPVVDRLVDNTPPSATINSPGPYLRGTVNLTSSTSDPGGANASGVVSVAYEYSTNGGGSWQSTGSSFDSTSVADGNVDLHVVATDAAGNSTTSAAVTSLVDNTKPVTTDNAPAGWQSSTVTVTLTPNDGGGSGINVTEYSVDGNPTYTVGTTVVIPAPADGSNDGAHTIAYFSVDNAGNIETVKTATVLIDATPPACPSCSAADYLRGIVTLSASPDESGSGIQSVEFEYTDAGGSSWTSIGTDTTGPAPYTADWDTTAVADGHYDLRIRVTDNASNVTTTNLADKVVDNTAPDVATVGAPTEGQLVTGTINITASASDATSPVASVRFFVRGSLLGTDTDAPWTQSWNTTTGPDGGATIQVVVEDMAGNTTSSAIRNVSVDNVSPTPTLSDPGQYLSGTVSLSASSDGDTVQVDFERRPAGGGSWVTIASDTTLPWATSLDTTTLADGLYDFRVVATDQSGNTGTSPIRANVRVDNTNPAGSITSPANGATVGGTSVALGGNYSDAGSGVASVQYELRPTGGGSWSAIATATSSPFGATWDATTVASGSYDLRPIITDRAGNAFTGPTITVTVDVSAPTIVLGNPGATISGTTTLNATVSGSGATQVVFGATPAGGGSWTSIGTDTATPWSTSFNTATFADGLYDLRATVYDSLGNSSHDVVAGIRIDNTAPRVVSSTPAEGSTVTSASSIRLVASEAATPVGVTLDGNPTVGPVISGTQIDYNTGPLGLGPHTLTGELQDSSGKKAPFRVHFTIWTSSPSSVAPYVEKNTSSSSPTTLEASDGFASATMPSGAWSSGGDWIVLRITPMAPPAGLTNGFSPGTEAIDVTAWWALAGTQVHQFSQPVNILMRSSEKGLVPATLEGGNWRVLPRVPTPGTLPAGWEDGFYTDAAGFHVLTKHLTVFALLRDVERPQPPQNVRGFLGPNGLTIRWTAGADNSGTYDFVTVYSGTTDTGHFGVDYTAAAIGPWAPGDTRVFRLMETDLAGNQSELTRPLLPVPSLIGKTPDQAAAALAERGFKLGTLTPGGLGAPGTITGPAGLVLAEEGAVIDVTVAPGGAFTKLVFKVHTAPKFKPAARKKIAARVSITRAARVTAELFSPRGVKIYTWRFSVKAGRTIVKLNIPRQVRRAGSYSMRWTARAGRDSVSRRFKLRLLGSRALSSTEPIEVVLAGQASRGAATKLPKRKPRVVTASGVEPTFDEAASRKTDTRVIVVDVDEFGLNFVRELHTVFPSVRIVALSSSPRTMARSLKAGATVALPRSTPPAVLAKVIQRLLNPAKPVSTNVGGRGGDRKTKA